MAEIIRKCAAVKVLEIDFSTGCRRTHAKWPEIEGLEAS
jgi:hypothetical protein